MNAHMRWKVKNMTRSEAIEHLKNIAIYSVQDGYTDEARQALDMAIKALEQPEHDAGRSGDQYCKYFRNERRGIIRRMRR